MLNDGIIAIGLAGADRRSITAANREAPIRHFSTTSAELGARQMGAATVLVIGLEEVSDGDLETIVKAADSAPPAQVIVRFRLSGTAMRRLSLLSGSLPVTRLSITGRDDIVQDAIRAASGDLARDARPRIIERLVAVAPPKAMLILTAVAAIGARRTTVPQLAAACGLSSRTLEWRLATARLVSGARVLGMMLSLHAAWYLDVLDLTVKQTAANCGFASRTALANFLKRHTHLAPSALGESSGFERLLKELRRSLDRAENAARRVPLADRVTSLPIRDLAEEAARSYTLAAAREPPDA